MSVAMNFQDRPPVLAGFLQKRREYVGWPSDAVGLSLRACLMRNWSHTVDEQAVQLSAAESAAQGDGDGLAAVGGKEMRRQFGMLALG